MGGLQVDLKAHGYFFLLFFLFLDSFYSDNSFGVLIFALTVHFQLSTNLSHYNLVNLKIQMPQRVLQPQSCRLIKVNNIKDQDSILDCTPKLVRNLKGIHPLRILSIMHHISNLY